MSPQITSGTSPTDWSAIDRPATASTSGWSCCTMPATSSAWSSRRPTRGLAADAAEPGEARVGHAEDAHPADVGHVAVEDGDVGVAGQRGPVLGRVVVPRHEVVGHVELVDEVADAGLAVEPERRQVAGVDHRLHGEGGRPGRGRSPAPCGFRWMSLMWRMRTSLGSAAGTGAGGHLAELVDLPGQHLEPAPHAVEVAELALHGVDHRGRPLQRAGVPGLARTRRPGSSTQTSPSRTP